MLSTKNNVSDGAGVRKLISPQENDDRDLCAASGGRCSYADNGPCSNSSRPGYREHNEYLHNDHRDGLRRKHGVCKPDNGNDADE